MKEQVKAFCERLGIDNSDELVPFYEEGVKLYQEHGTAITNTDRLIRLNNQYNFFRKWFDDVLAAAKMVEQDEDLLLYTYVLHAIIKADHPLYRMKTPDRQRLDTDFAPMYSLLFCLEDMIEKMEKRGLPYQVISDTLQGFDAEINDYYDIFGRSGMRIYVFWFMLFIRCDLIRVGRLNFEMITFNHKVRVYQKGDDVKILIDGQEMHKKGMVFGSAGQEDEEGKFLAEITEDGDTVTGYGVNEYGECVPEKITLKGYTEILRQGDKAVSVHIPAHEPFTPEICEASYAEATRIFRTCYPDFPLKAYCCFSWMLEKRLKDIMGRDTNITRFADGYHAFPLKADGNGVYSFLYHLEKPPVSPDELPEENSMQKRVKDYIKAGNYFYSKGGIRLP